MARRKPKADCQSDTRGGRWAGIPICVIESAAYRNCSAHARAILVEMVAQMNGYNNGEIVLSQRYLVAALACHPRKVVRGIAELMENGLIDIAMEGKWKERRAREYRLTFVSTKSAPATNDYLAYSSGKQSGASKVASTKFKSASTVEPARPKVASRVEAARLCDARKTAISSKPSYFH